MYTRNNHFVNLGFIVGLSSFVIMIDGSHVCHDYAKCISFVNLYLVATLYNFLITIVGQTNNYLYYRSIDDYRRYLMIF